MALRDIIWKDVSEKEWLNPNWQIRNRLSGLKGLKALPFLKSIDTKRYEALLNKYKWASTPYYLNLIDPSDEYDPIRTQVIPDLKEIEFTLSDSCPDPLLENEYKPLPGLIHRYEDRVLLLVTNSCMSYCRHCNRKRAWKRPESISFDEKEINGIKSYLQSNLKIREVIISGGDPLTLPIKKLEYLLYNLKQIKNIEVIRIGTRLPVVLPMAITNKLCKLLKKYRPIWLNTHFNHPKEITKEAKKAIEKILLCGIPISNQTVLLKGVNDNLNTLRTLFYSLQKIMVRPYYLFQCDHVSGVDHFRVPLSKGIEIMNKLWGNMSGLCMPSFVADLPEGLGKARLLSSHLLELHKDEAFFSTFEGKIIRVKST